MNGPDVVFLHAFPLNTTMWAGQVTALESAGYRVVTAHTPGFGEGALAQADLFVYAEAVLRDLDSKGMDRAVFVGLSMGGYLAFRIFERAPDRVLGLVLADTRAGPDPAQARDVRTEQARRVQAEGTGWLADEMIPKLLCEATRRDRPRVVESVRAMIGEAGSEGVARALLAMRDRPDSRTLLGRVEVPSLVLVGEDDDLMPPDEARDMDHRLADSRLAVIPRSGHLSNLENPDAFNAALLDYLASMGGPYRPKVSLAHS